MELEQPHANVTRFILYVSAALCISVPAIFMKLSGWEGNSATKVAAFGAAILAAGFMLSWAAEAAEHHFSQGLVLACLALVTVLPEYAVDMYYAFEAGKDPGSPYVHYAAANMTGANRLLVGLGWPLMVLVNWWKSRQRSIELARVNAIEVAYLLGASAYAFIVLIRDRISLFDSAILFAIFCLYLWSVRRLPKADSEAEEESEPVPSAVLNRMQPAQQLSAIAALTLVAGFIILISAEPFAESIVAAGRLLKIDEFLLIQWIAPLASEAPAVAIATLYVLSGRAAGGLTAMISDKINQWTLLVGMLPAAMSVGASRLMSLPFDGRQHEEFFLTAAQSLFAVALISRLRLSAAAAISLAVLFVVQMSLAYVFRNDSQNAINALTSLGWFYLILAGILFVRSFSTLQLHLREAIFGLRKQRSFEE